MAQTKPKVGKKSNNGGRQDISLMTLLANEATSDSRKILKKYDRPDAKHCTDLEVKLAELYFGQSDKKQLEKELSDIHPHKEWIMKNQKTDPIIEEKEIEVIAEQPAIPTNFCPSCQAAKMSNFMSLDGPATSTSVPEHSHPISMLDYIGIMGMMATIGLTFYVITKNK